MAARRDYKAEYQRRQARARSLGYGSYYQRRVRAGAPPEAPAPTGQRLRRLAGHAGARDLLDYLREGDLIVLEFGIASIESFYRERRIPTRQAKKGFRVVTEQVFRRVDKLVIPDDDRPMRTFTVRNHTRAQMERLIEEERRRGAIWSPKPSLDQRRLLKDSETEGGY